VLLGVMLALPAVAAATTNSYVVVYKRTVANVGTETHGLQAEDGFMSEFRYGSALKGFAANLSSGQLSAVKANAAVAYVTPDITFHATGLVALDAGEILPVGIRRIGAATSTLVHAGTGVGIAVCCCPGSGMCAIGPEYC
jgi:Peptidase inhibitor I9